MTPAEVIVAALREHQHTRYGWLSGKEAAEHAEVALGALAEAGMVVVSAEDLHVMLGHWRRPATNQLGGQDAYDRLRAALPKETTDE